VATASFTTLSALASATLVPVATFAAVEGRPLALNLRLRLPLLYPLLPLELLLLRLRLNFDPFDTLETSSTDAVARSRRLRPTVVGREIGLGLI
jgi:hypothetical protein